MLVYFSLNRGEFSVRWYSRVNFYLATTSALAADEEVSQLTAKFVDIRLKTIQRE